jgi:hypothetical protein
MTEAFNKIGFHVGPGGNSQGLGDWERSLDSAGIPFCLKSADHYGPLFEAANLAKTSGLAHALAFRLTTRGQNDGFDYDVPNYDLAPQEAAVRHWQRTLQKLPPEFDKSLVWLEPINEVDKGRSDWLGHFASEIGQLALDDGYKVALFGWSSGEPEPGDWETEGMQRFLRFCAAHPQQIAVSLHEYSYKVDDIWFMRGFQIGRFQQLFQVCDKLQIARPNVIITEWGWTYERVPDPDQAMKDIEAVGELYAQYPQLLGAAIWYLGGGFSAIANQAQRYIEPLTGFTLNHRFEVEEVPDTVHVESPGGLLLGEGEQPGTSNARFVMDVTIPDNSEIVANAPFRKTWRVENNGSTTWGLGYHLVHVAGEAMTAQLSQPLPAAAPGEQVDISLDLSAPSAPGNYFGDWRLQDDKGNLFGDIVFLKIVVLPAAPALGVNNGRFVADVTIPDDSPVEANASFTKTWRVENNGDLAWGAGYQLAFLRGTAMTDTRAVPLRPAVAGQQVDVSVDLIAPSIPGTYWGDWRLQDPGGNFFGEIVYVRIVVPQPESAIGIVPLSQCDPSWRDDRLGNSLSDKNICQWGCLLTAFTMVANAFGEELTPPQLNRRIVRGPGFIQDNLTPWNVLSKLYDHIVYGGKLDIDSTPDVVDRINAAMNRGELVVVRVDNTPNTPYNSDDQHWVLIVGRNGTGFQVNDPLTGQEVSLAAVYGRPDRPLESPILSALFYRSTKMAISYAGPSLAGPARLQTGMNVNPDAPHSNPFQDDTLKGLNWARFVFKAAANNRTVEEAFGQYDPIVKAYAELGTASLIILNQETLWGNAPWTGNGDWSGYADQLADAAAKIAGHYAKYGQQVAYEIWNEGDLADNPASVFIPPKEFAVVLKGVAAAIRGVSADSKLIFGGLASGPGAAIPYLRQCKAEMGGQWPVDAIGIHPYGRWATRAPFDWGQHFGTLGEAFGQYEAAFPEIPLWVTEIGVAADSLIGPEYYATIADYMKDVYKTVGDRYAGWVKAVIWFGWSDFMRNAGVVDHNGNPKAHIYPVFKAVRSWELEQFGL